ncbi:MAG: hypothetical protein Ct9H300mP18_04120 [Candidatus Neomarinimicrobiota bacterium]|nr:MAG: hypothetical protein Ct9H300mP18_04120 [Candidatus Neomarinimicrobiota bacterium]
MVLYGRLVWESRTLPVLIIFFVYYINMQYNNPFKSTSFHHTFDFGKNLSNSIEYGSVILLRGDLGSGKTTFCKGFASGLGFKDEILSPTYSILNEYEISGKNLYHFDLYRLKSINEFIEIGGLEYLNSPISISLIEWPDLISDIDIKNMINIKFEYLSENERLITVLS